MKYVFLVENIKDEHFTRINGEIVTTEKFPHTLTYNFYKETYYPQITIDDMWLNESLNLLKNYSKNIEFQELEQVQKYGLDKNKKYFYFINLLHINKLNLHTINPKIFLRLTTKDISFLERNNIPVVIDMSIENNNVDTIQVFFNDLKKFVLQAPRHANLLNLKWKLVLSTYLHNEKLKPIIDSFSTLNIELSVFPLNYFWYTHCQSLFLNKVWVKRSRDAAVRNKLLSNVKHKKILENITLHQRVFDNVNSLEEISHSNFKLEEKFYSTFIWETYCHNPNISRLLLQAKLESENLLKYGRYSRLRSSKLNFENQSKYLNGLPEYVTDKFISDLDTVIQIDDFDSRHNFPIYIKYNSDTDLSMFRIVTESFNPLLQNDIYYSDSMLTEKSASAIIACHPFIALGGRTLKRTLQYYGFVEYEKLEMQEFDSILDEINYVVDRVKYICSLSTPELTKLNERWKLTAKYNYTNFYKLDVEQEYIRALENTNFYQPDI